MALELLLDDDVLRLVLAWLAFRDHQALSSTSRFMSRSQLRRLVVAQSVLRLPPLQSVVFATGGGTPCGTDAAWRAYCGHTFLQQLQRAPELVDYVRRVLVPLSVAQRVLALLQFAPHLETVRFYNDAVPATSKGAVKQITVMDVGYMSSLTGLRSLDLSTVRHVNCLDAVAALTNLRSLDLSQTNIDDADTDVLGELQNLEVLNLRRTRVGDLSFVKSLQASLRWLDVSDTRVGDISPIKHLRNLEYLNVNRNWLGDVTALRFLTALTTLKLCDTGSLGPLELVLRAPNLLACHLHDTMLSDLHFLVSTSKLRYLDIRRTHTVLDLGPLAAVPELETLLIDDSHLVVDDVGGSQAHAHWASRLHTLKHLQIDQISAEIDDDGHYAYAYPIDGSILAHFTSLETLELPALVDVRPMYEVFSTLRELELHNWSSKDLQQLALDPRAAKLEALKLTLPASPEPVDLTPLETFEGLERLELVDVLFEDLAPIGSLARLCKLDLSLKNRAKRQLARKFQCLQNFSFLAALTNLEALNLEGRVDFRDASPLASLRALKRVSLQGTKVPDVSALGSLTQLVSLNVASTPVESVADLAGRLPMLESLWLPERVRCDALQQAADSSSSFPRLRFLWHRDDFNCLWTNHRHADAKA